MRRSRTIGDLPAVRFLDRPHAPPWRLTQTRSPMVLMALLTSRNTDHPSSSSGGPCESSCPTPQPARKQPSASLSAASHSHTSEAIRWRRDQRIASRIGRPWRDHWHGDRRCGAIHRSGSGGDPSSAAELAGTARRCSAHSVHHARWLLSIQSRAPQSDSCALRGWPCRTEFAFHPGQ